QLFQERVVHALLHVQALHGEAGLAAVEEATDRDRASRALEIRVVQHDARVTSAELERDLLQALRRARHHLLAGWGRTREGDLPDQGVPDDRLTCRRAQHNVDDALRQSALDQRLDARESG